MLCLQDFIVERLKQLPGVQLETPEGAFYVMPNVSALVGPSVRAEGFGAIPDVEALCRREAMLSLPSPT